MDSDIKPSKQLKSRFYELLKTMALTDGDFHHSVHIGGYYGRNLRILSWSTSQHIAICDEIKRQFPLIQTFTLHNILSATIVNLFEVRFIGDDNPEEIDIPHIESVYSYLDTKSINNALQALISIIHNKIKRWTAFIFVEGLALENIDEVFVEVGILYPITEGPLQKVIAEETVLASGDLPFGDDLPYPIETYICRCNCYLTIDVSGENRFANQLSESLAQQIIDIITLYDYWYGGSEANCKGIRILGQPSYNSFKFTIKCNPPLDRDPQIDYTFDLMPTRFPLIITKDDLTKWNINHFDYVLRCIDYSDTITYTARSRVNSAYTWFGRAIRALTPDEQFMSLIIVLECLFRGEGRDNRSQRISDIVSTLIGTDYNSRQGIANLIKNHYTMRSNLVHKGIPVNQDLVGRFKRITARIIMEFIHRENKSSLL